MSNNHENYNVIHILRSAIYHIDHVKSSVEMKYSYRMMLSIEIMIRKKLINIFF